MSDFKVGDEVVCVDDERIEIGVPQRPRRGAHYHVRALHEDDNPLGVGLLLSEAVNPIMVCRDWKGTLSTDEPSFFAHRFRKIDPAKIEIFRAMCVEAPKQKTKATTGEGYGG